MEDAAIETQIPIQKEKRKPYILIGIVIGICLLGIGLITLVKWVSKTVQQPIIVVNPTPTPDPLAPKNILLLGYGGAGHDGGLLTDTMIVGHIIPKEKKVILISIPRDLWVPIETVAGTESGHKINAVFAVGTDHKAYPNVPKKYFGDNGGLLMAKDAVAKIIGEPIDWAAAVDFSGFSSLIKTLGGIFVDVPFSFEDTLYPIKGKEKESCGKSEEDIKALTATLSATLLEKEFPCRYETLKFEKGKQFMDGETALKFVRSRHSDVNGGDFGRSMRQQAFLLGIKNRLLSFSSATKIIPLMKTALTMVQTDVTLTDLSGMFERYGMMSSYTTDVIAITDQTVLMPSTSTDGQYILIPKTGENDFGSIKTYISSELARISESTKSAVVQ
jgi:LCP family protein required for cell wall assembly